MNHGGTLKKRKKRNITKVKAELASVVQNDIFPRTDTKQSSETAHRCQFQKDSPLKNDGNTTSRTRVTRNPNFHREHSQRKRDHVIINVTSLKVDKFPSSRCSNKRSHFLDPQCMQRLKQLLWLGITTGSFPWKWNETKYKIETWRPWMVKIWWVQWVFVSIQTFLLTGFQMYIFIKSFHKAKTFRQVFMSSFSFLWYSYAVLLNINLYFYKEKTRHFINTMLRFNGEYVHKFLLHLDDYQDGGRWIINCAVISNIVQVFVCVSFFLKMYREPWYLFSYLDESTPFYWKIPFAFQEYMVVGQVITSYMLLSWIVVAHANTLHFWLRESHKNNDSDYTRESLRTTNQALETYRALAVLNNGFNECVAPLGLPFVKYVMASAMVPCGFVLIKTSSHLFVEEFPAWLTYPLGILDCATAGYVIMKMGSEVYDLSTGFVDSWGQTKDKNLRRILMSFPALRFWVGRFYFITMSTTITFFKVCFDIITDCIITFP